MGPRVLITDIDLGDGELERDILVQRLDADVVVLQCRTADDVVAAVTELDPHALLVQWAPITQAVLDAAPSLQVISRFGIGLDMIDQTAAAARGIPVLNVPHYCTEEVALHAVALAFSLLRRLPQLDAELRAGTWDAARWAPDVLRLSTATVGLVGLGRIGRKVADAFAVWGARVLVHDPVQGDDPYPRVTLEELARSSDVISLHVPLLSETEHLVDAEFLARCDRRPILVNVSRGGLVDAAAVAAALASGGLAGAGLDVFATEPLPTDDALRAAPNTILTPHAARCSSAALPELRKLAALNVVHGLGKDLP